VSRVTSPTKLGRCKVEKIGHLSYLKTPDNALKKTKFTEAQIVFALRQADTGVTVAEVCRKMGISEATYYNWKKKYGGLGVPELRRLKQLEEENQQLKQLVADLSLDKQMLQDVLKKKF
jgi:putative transposase